MDPDQGSSPDYTVVDSNGNVTIVNPKARAVLPTIPGRWIQDSASGRWWYSHNDGGYTRNSWEYINGEWYYFDASGWMLTGWIRYIDNWYYCNSDSKMQIGWILVAGKWYYANSEGATVYGWFHDGTKNYYTDEKNGDWIDNTGTRMIQDALQFLGNKYVWGGTSLTNGIDCSGYTMQIHARAGISIPRLSADQWASCKNISASSLKPGDIVRYDGHIAFYIGKCVDGNDYIVHARGADFGICLDKRLYSSKLIGHGSFWR